MLCHEAVRFICKEKASDFLRMVQSVRTLLACASACLKRKEIVDKPARLTIELLFGFGSDSVFVKLNKMKTNTETAILSRK